MVDRDVVVACARTKLAVVAEDERDAGRRQTLNLGHTVGHAIETATGYARYRHGEAVGLGLLAALTLSNQPGLRADVEGLLAARGLPTRLDPAVDLEAVRERRRARQEAPRRRRRLRARRGSGRAGDRRAGAGRRAARRSGRVALRMRNRISVMHGVNFDALDRRPKLVYGDFSLDGLERTIGGFARELGLEVRFFQSNLEGEYVEEIHRAPDYADALILNPGAWTHYAWAIRDAVEIAGLPAVRGPPLRRHGARGVPEGVGDPRRLRRLRLGQGRGRLPRRARAR